MGVSSLTAQTLPDLDGLPCDPLRGKVPAKAIKLANVEVEQSEESLMVSHGHRLLYSI